MDIIVRYLPGSEDRSVSLKRSRILFFHISVYVDVEGVTAIKLMINTNGADFERLWNIKIQFLACASNSLGKYIELWN